MKDIDGYGTIRFYNDKKRLHRDKYWYINGKKIDCKTQDEFLRLIKMKAFWQ